MRRKCFTIIIVKMKSKTANTIVKIQSGQNWQYLLNLGGSLVRNRIFVQSYSMSLKILMSLEKKVTCLVTEHDQVTRYARHLIFCLLAPNSPILATPKPGLCKTPFLLCYTANGQGSEEDSKVAGDSLCLGLAWVPAALSTTVALCSCSSVAGTACEFIHCTRQAAHSTPIFRVTHALQGGPSSEFPSSFLSPSSHDPQSSSCFLLSYISFCFLFFCFFLVTNLLHG